MWNEPERARRWVKSVLPRSHRRYPDQMSRGLEDVAGLLDLAVEADDEETFNEAVAELDTRREAGAA